MPGSQHTYGHFCEEKLDNEWQTMEAYFTWIHLMDESKTKAKTRVMQSVEENKETAQIELCL